MKTLSFWIIALLSINATIVFANFDLSYQGVVTDTNNLSITLPFNISIIIYDSAGNTVTNQNFSGQTFFGNTSGFDAMLTNLTIYYNWDYFLNVSVNNQSLPTQSFKSPIGFITSESILNKSIGSEHINTSNWIYVNNTYLNNRFLDFYNSTYIQNNYYDKITSDSRFALKLELSNNISNHESTFKHGNTTAEIWSVVDNQTFLLITDQRYNDSLTLTGYVVHAGLLGNLTLAYDNDSRIDNKIGSLVNLSLAQISVSLGSGLQNNSYNSSTVYIEGFISNPYLAIGYSENWLLQSESFATTWATMNKSVVVANNEISPIGTLIAEKLIGNNSNFNAGVQQRIINESLGNFTFSVWLKNINNNFTEANVTINIETNNETKIGKTIYLTPEWQRYAITQNFVNTHVNKTVYIRHGANNISAWGAQLEPGNNARPYAAERTTSANINPASSIYGRLPITSTGAVTGVGITSTSTGTFAGAITETLAPAFVSTDGHVITSTTAATLAAPIQLSPRLRQSGTVWDTSAGASRTVNFKQEVIPISGNSGSAKMVWEYGYNSVADIAITQLMALNSEGTLDVYGTTLGSEVLNNYNFTQNASFWNWNGGWQIGVTTQNMTRYQFSLGANGNLSQNSTDFLIPLKPNRWYELNYNISGTGVAGCVAYVNNETSTKNVYLPGVSVTTAGQLYDINFKTNANPGNFTITARCTAGSFYLDSLLLREKISGDIIANGLFTGGAETGLKIDEYGHAGFGTTNLTSQVNINGTGNLLNITNTTNTILSVTDVNGGETNIYGQLYLNGNIVVGDNSSWNQSHASTLYSSIIWGYNQTLAANAYSDINNASMKNYVDSLPQTNTSWNESKGNSLYTQITSVLADYVPYNNANQSVNLNNYSLNATSFIIGTNILNVSEWGFLDNQDQTVNTTSNVRHNSVGVGVASSGTSGVFTLLSGGNIRPSADATNAIKIQNAGGNLSNTIFDTTNMRVGIGGTNNLPTTKLDLQFSINGIDGMRIVNTNTSSSAETRFYIYDDPVDQYIAFTMPGTTNTGALFGMARNLFTGIFVNSVGSGVDRMFALGTVHNTNMFFATNNLERMRINASGQVGIGVTSPTAMLHLKAGSTAAATAPLKFTSGSLQTTSEVGAIEFLTDDFYGTITTGALRKKFVLDNGTSLTPLRVPYVTINGRLTDTANFVFDGNILYINGTSSKLGIGTSSPTNILSFGGNTTRTIWLERQTTSNTSGSGLIIQSGGATSGATNKMGGDLNLSSGISTGTNSSNIYFNTATPNTTGGVLGVVLVSGGTEYESIDDYYSTSGGSGSGALISVKEITDGVITLIGSTASATGSNYIIGDILTILGGNNSDATVMVTSITSGTLDNNPTTKMTILGNGNVGIGVTSPTANLHIATPSNLAMHTILNISPNYPPFNNPGGSIIINAASGRTYEGTNQPGGSITMKTGDGSGSIAPAGNFTITTGAASGGTLNGGVIELTTGAGGGGGTYGDIIMVKNGGSVGIGTIVPNGSLDVRGNEVRIWSGAGTINTALGQGDLYIEDDLEIDGLPNCITPTDVQIETDGTICKGASSMRFKENINNITLNSSKLDNLQITSYNWKNDAKINKTVTLGLIAEDVYKTMPECVTLDDDGQPLSVNYECLTIFLLQGYKDQQEKIRYLMEECEK
jgi:hypothetical protein